MNMNKTNPLLLDIPDYFESERLIIRAPKQGDGDALNEAVKESFDQLRPWMPWAQEIPALVDSESVVRRAHLKFMERTDLMLLLILKKSGQLVGCSGLHRIDWEARKFEIGYWVRTSFSKQGLITEAADAITDYAIHELQANRIEIRCDERNTQSAKVAQRLGFTLEGILRNDASGTDGTLRSTKVFSKVRGIEF
ncbi:GNAT family N-acetyltransferase [Paenibacillus lentus]|uniref:N-acetyltransferase n=1 Tax=Paenibacillus lentus TaxID=1338368 RepID=A0A3Q8SE25_9BACL|nr:GNAT family N-acetyltransferase [Paenibacillus lentus]AZK48651.1 N-acetyltransferase [Paenibacillus lentus]